MLTTVVPHNINNFPQKLAVLLLDLGGFVSSFDPLEDERTQRRVRDQRAAQRQVREDSPERRRAFLASSAHPLLH